MARVLELGSYVAPAFCGMILAEQGCYVEKWTNDKDPILGLNRGSELWAWINSGKRVEKRPASQVSYLRPDDFGIIVDNIRPSTLERWGIDPPSEAKRLNCAWVSLRAESGEVSFDATAQAQAWMDFAPYMPFYIGDTTAGLWMAFKALAKLNEPGHYTIPQATALMKLVEGELCVDIARDGATVPWDAEQYGIVDGVATVAYKGELYRQPVLDREAKWNLLRHKDGRMVI